MMKRLISLLLVVTLISCMGTSVLAANETASVDLSTRISRTAVERIMGDAPAMTTVETEKAMELIAEKANSELMIETAALQMDATATLIAQTEKINAIEEELCELGAVPLTVADIYALHGDEYRPGAPSEPGDTNYVSFYAMTTYINNYYGTDYEVYSIVGYSPRFPQTNPPSKPISVIMAERDEFAVYPDGEYTRTDFGKYLDLAVTAGEYLFEDAFEEVPILQHLSTLYDVVDFFTPVPNTSQVMTCLYEAQQTFVYSYVAEADVGYFDFMQTGERIAGFFDIDCRRYGAGTPISLPLDNIQWEATSDYYADYEHAVDLYRNYSLHSAYYVGEIDIVLRDEANQQQVKHTISMPYYSSIWSIPGV